MYVSVCVSMSVCVTLPVGTVFLYLNNNRSSPNFTEVFLSITPSDVFFLGRFFSQILDLLNHFVKRLLVISNFFSCAIEDLLIIISPKKIQLLLYKIFQHPAKISGISNSIFCTISNFFFFVPRLIGPYESPNFSQKCYNFFEHSTKIS